MEKETQMKSTHSNPIESRLNDEVTPTSIQLLPKLTPKPNVNKLLIQFTSNISSIHLNLNS